MNRRGKDSTKIRHEKKRVVSVALPPTSSEFSEYRRSENQRQQQLANAQTQIDNVAQAVVCWLLDNPAAKERPYFFALQERVAELQNIIARLVQRKSLPMDGQQWSATVSEVFSLLEKAGKVSKKIGWAVLLPKKLPGDETEREAGALKRLNRREVTEILENKGWSLRDFATQAKVDVHTVTSYMKEKSTPYRSTRKKLADALGISTESLPD